MEDYSDVFMAALYVMMAAMPVAALVYICASYCSSSQGPESQALLSSLFTSDPQGGAADTEMTNMADNQSDSPITGLK